MDNRLIEGRSLEPATERTPVIARYEEMRYGMFIRFEMDTFRDKRSCSFIEFIEGPAPLAQTYCPANLDVDQWIGVAKKAGMRYAVLTVKHWLGFALWDSKYTDYDVASSGNKTDVVAEFVKACRKHEVAPCFLYTLGWDVAHLVDRKMRDDEWYEHANKQIAELLTNYGPITTLWFDGMEKGKKVPLVWLQRTYNTVKSLQPDCLVVIHTPRPEYSREVKWWPTDVFQPGRCPAPPEGHNPHMEYGGKTYYLPMESLDTIVEEWFWRPNQKLKPLAVLLKHYRETVGRGANLPLNVAPDREGKIPAEQVERLMQLSEAIRTP